MADDRPQDDDFAGTEAHGGLVLAGGSLLALVLANSRLAHAYHAALDGALGPLSLHAWINDGLMALFFLAVGLEVKRAVLEGDLADPRARRLPVIAALGGMVVPALLYLGLAPGAARGWAIPAATDIAFAQGVLLLGGRAVAPSLRLLLTSIAIADDVGAVAVIALAYTPAIDLPLLGCAAALLAAMALLNRLGVRALWPYLALFPLLWGATYLSGVHATIAGVAAALTIPAARGRDGSSPLCRLERRLHPLVAFAIVPLFALANAGLPLGGVGWAALAAPVPLAIAVALVVGKPLGVLVGIGAALRLRVAALPAGIPRLQLLGVAQLCGIGFTMSLFIGGLAFADPAAFDAVRLGVLAGSLLSAIAGLAILRLAAR